jgi:hypothetical protein
MYILSSSLIYIHIKLGNIYQAAEDKQAIQKKGEDLAARLFLRETEVSLVQ